MRRHVFNTRRKKAMKEVVKAAGQLIASKSVKEVTALLPKVYRAVDKAVKRGVIKANAAARIKSKLAKRIRVISG